MAESYSLKAILSATDKGFSSTLKNAARSVGNIESKISGISFGFLSGVGMAAFNSLTSGAGELIGEINNSSKAWQTFEGNMAQFGKKNDIPKVKKELQDFAETTVYSSSDMASTYAQLEAVGTKSTLGLVKGFGGLAAAAENPQQAMKSLSQQATQMAAKPKVAWEDFKIMLEQSPAGMAAVAKEMGMSTEKLISKIQKGEIKTQDFFKAVEQAGNSPGFQEQATKAKTLDQAMDGLKETIGNKFLPAFQFLSNKGISVVGKLTDKLGTILNADDITSKLSSGLEKAGKYWDAFLEAFDGVGTKIGGAFQAIRTSLADVVGAFGSTQNVSSFKDIMEGVADVIKKVADFATKHSDTIAKFIAVLPKLLIAIKGFKIAKTVAPFVSTFAGAIGSLASKGIGTIAGKLFGISKSQEEVGTTSAESGAQMLTAAKAYALMGVAVLTIAVGFALLAQSAIALANAGGLAIGVMAGLVIGVAAMGVGMAFLMKSLAPMSAQLMPVATAFLAMGAAVLLVSAGFALLAATSIQLANAGGLAIGVMVGMVATIALLAVGAAALGPALVAGAAGFTAFGVAILMVSAGALLASAGIALLAGQLPTIATYGLQSATAITALGGSLVVFAVGATTAGASLIALGAGFGVAAVGVVAFGAGMVTGAAGTVAMAAALKAVNSSMKSISTNAKNSEKSLKNMNKSVDAVESGLNALGDVAKNSMKSLINAFDQSAAKSQSAGRQVGLGFTQGLQSESAGAVAVASKTTTQVVTKLRSGRDGAYSAGAYISLGFAQGMRSQLGAIRSAANEIVAAANKAIEAKAKIHSPSDVTDKYGFYYGKGLVNGLLGMVKDAKAAAEKLICIPAMYEPELAFAGTYGGELSDDYEYHRSAQYTIIVPLDIDGREFARAEATYIQEELNKRQTRENRKKGKI